MFNKVVKELKVLGVVDYIKVKRGLKDTRELSIYQQNKLGLHQKPNIEVTETKVEDPYNLRSLVFYEDQIGTTIVRRTVLRREEHGSVFNSTKKNPYTNVVVEYATILVISQTECKIISVKEVREYIAPSSTRGGGGIQSGIRDKARQEARNW